MSHYRDGQHPIMTPVHFCLPLRIAQSQPTVITTNLAPTHFAVYWSRWCVSGFAKYCISMSQFPNQNASTFSLAEGNYHNYRWGKITGIVYRIFKSWPDTDLTSLNVTRQLPIQDLRSDACLNISVFTRSQRSAQFGQVPSVCVIQFRVLQLH